MVMKILITGCSGLIGSALCERLLKTDHEIIGYDLDPEFMLTSRGIDKEFKVIIGDIRDTDKLEKALTSVDACYNLAAVSGVTASRQNPLRALEINVQGTWSVLEACRLSETERVVTASSNHIYGRQTRYPVNENAPLNQLDTYSATKIAADYVARMYAHNYGTPVVIMRNTNCFGPHDPHNDHIIPGTIKSIMKGEVPVIRGRGTTKKSYLYIDDVVDAYFDILEHVPNQIGEPFNVAGENRPVIDVVETIAKVMGYPVTPKILGESDDQNDEDLDSRKFRRLTGWFPKHTFAKGIKKTVEWMTGRPN